MASFPARRLPRALESETIIPVSRKLSKSAQKETQQTGFERRIGHIADGHVDPCGFFQNAFFVAECIKALSAVVAAHAAAAHAAEAHAAGGQVNNGIVDAAAAEGDGGEHALHIISKTANPRPFAGR